MKLNVRSTFPFIIFIRSNTQRPRGVAPGTFLLPLGHSYARWRLDRFFLYFRERKLLIVGHIPQRRMQCLESFPNELDLRQYGMIVVVIKIVKFGVMIYVR